MKADKQGEHGPNKALNPTPIKRSPKDEVYRRRVSAGVRRLAAASRLAHNRLWLYDRCEVGSMAKGGGSQWMWVYDPKSKPGTKPPDKLKQEISDAAEIILAEWRQRYVKPVPKNYECNYLTRVYTRWRGNYFSFCGTYACSHPDAISPSFETRFARLEYLGRLGFNLAYFRHTGKWWQTEQAISLADGLKTIRENGIYHPS